MRRVLKLPSKLFDMRECFVVDASHIERGVGCRLTFELGVDTPCVFAFADC